ncbi:uncharacterized protein BJ171DRAFT_310734 [Polychytrium aggregatum]|uniref:uncharacterized protein n=1 Tax=Polychytrium aggregatum TaxID=110093 RepID=UPI0022FEBC15|nr:uncharacterized protein BJ171DRAFT_310734 [Polychytrium aggregatum]KAI9207043.1 hypothetical protein BJ171DRAFT_310734 [Polychytrium aggregatum]
MAAESSALAHWVVGRSNCPSVPPQQGAPVLGDTLFRTETCIGFGGHHGFFSLNHTQAPEYFDCGTDPSCDPSECIQHTHHRSTARRSRSCRLSQPAPSTKLDTLRNFDPSFKTKAFVFTLFSADPDCEQPHRAERRPVYPTCTQLSSSLFVVTRQQPLADDAVRLQSYACSTASCTDFCTPFPEWHDVGSSASTCVLDASGSYRSDTELAAWISLEAFSTDTSQPASVSRSTTWLPVQLNAQLATSSPSSSPSPSPSPSPSAAATTADPNSWSQTKTILVYAGVGAALVFAAVLACILGNVTARHRKGRRRRRISPKQRSSSLSAQVSPSTDHYVILDSDPNSARTAALSSRPDGLTFLGAAAANAPTDFKQATQPGHDHEHEHEPDNGDTKTELSGCTSQQSWLPANLPSVISQHHPEAVPPLPANRSSLANFTVGLSSLPDVASTLGRFNTSSSGSRSPKTPEYPVDSWYVVGTRFRPTRGDEISLGVGQVVHLRKAFDDGWGYGVNDNTKKKGFFPLHSLIAP